MKEREAVKFLLDFNSRVNLDVSNGAGIEFNFDYSEKLRDALDIVLDQYIFVRGDLKITNEPGQIFVDKNGDEIPSKNVSEVKK